MTVSRRGLRLGLTLIELVIVLVILAALAMLVVPRLGYLKDQSDSASAAAAAADVATNIEVYKASTGYYPSQFDSLLIGTGSTAAPTAVYNKFFLAPPSASPGIPTWLSMEDLGTNIPGGSPNYYFSAALAGLIGTTDNVMDHDSASTNPNDSGVNARPRKSGGPNNFAVVNTSDATGIAIAKACGYVTGVLPTGVKLIALGVGPGSKMVGKTMVSPPVTSAAPSTEYGRYIAIFAVYDNAGDYGNTQKADLKTVVDARGSSISSNVASYKNSSLDR